MQLYESVHVDNVLKLLMCDVIVKENPINFARPSTSVYIAQVLHPLNVYLAHHVVSYL